MIRRRQRTPAETKLQISRTRESYWMTGEITAMSPGVTIEDLYQEIKKIRETMVRREDLEALIDTVEILSNPETMEWIKKGDLDIRQERVREISSVDDLLQELS
jgi:hypothetical protein